jgi:hypothetical protein
VHRGEEAVGLLLGLVGAKALLKANAALKLGQRIVARRKALQKAQATLGDGLYRIGNRSRSKTPATVVAGTSTETGITAFGQSVKGCGARRCAELDVAAQVGGDPKNIVYTKPVRPSSGKIIPVCKTCQKELDKSQFPRGTPFE